MKKAILIATTDEALLARLKDEAWKQRTSMTQLALAYIRAGLEKDAKSGQV